jgi:hypothetical protein
MRKTLTASIVLAVLALAIPALAGPPFVCHSFEIGSAKSLPFDSHNWLGVRSDYDIHRVVADTEAVLTPSTPTLVRMETLRRAALYASLDRRVAEQLIAAVMSRVSKADQAGEPMAMALFDAGYLVEALSEIEQFGNHMNLGARDKTLAGLTQSYEARSLLEKSAALKPGDATIEFALGLISRAPENAAHFTNARAGAKHDALLASNLVKLQLQ